MVFSSKQRQLIMGARLLICGTMIELPVGIPSTLLEMPQPSSVRDGVVDIHWVVSGIIILIFIRAAVTCGSIQFGCVDMMQHPVVWVIALLPRVVTVRVAERINPRLHFFQFGCPVSGRLVAWFRARCSGFLLRSALSPLGTRGWGDRRSICSCHSHSLDVFGCSGARVHLRRWFREVQARGVWPFQTHHSRIVSFGSHLRCGERSQPDALLRLRVPDFRHPLPPCPHPHPIVVPGTRGRRCHRCSARPLDASRWRFLGKGRGRVLRQPQHFRTSPAHCKLLLPLRLLHHSQAPAILSYSSIHKPQRLESPTQ